MSDENPIRRVDRRPMTFEEAIGNAARLLEHAELETDLSKMQVYGGIADSWTTISALMLQKANL